MDLILVKLFATALALSEVTTHPDAVKTKFDPVEDRGEVVQVLRDGCAHMKSAFDIESINIDDLINTALDDPAAVGTKIKAFHGLDFGDLHTAYKQFCKNENVANPVVDIGEVITFYDNAIADLPDPARLKGKQLPAMTTVVDGRGNHYADVFEPGNRRIWAPLADIPDYVQKAFVAAEDRRFFQHHGIDERGIIRAFIGDLAEPGRPQGGSTITQQVVKNLLVGADVSYERKIREMIVASRLEHTLGKDDILELYINSAYLGRGSWGIEMAAHSYFGKSAKDLTLPEGAMLAGLLKGPSFYNPERHPDRARERLTYVLGRMQEDGVINAAQKEQGARALPRLVAFTLPHRDSGFNFVDYLGREAKTDGVDSLTAQSYTVHSTVDAQLQRDAEAALQEGLAQYEISSGRVQFRGPEAGLADAIKKLSSDGSGQPAWQRALQALRLPLYDVHWTPAVILQKGDGKNDSGAIRVGMPDGRIAPLTGITWDARRGLGLYDVIYVKLVESRTAAAGRANDARANDPKAKGAKLKPAPVAVSAGVTAQLRVRPKVQGAALVLQNKTGRILAMAGGFSYPLSQLNRTWQSQRQPGSAIKPITYLTALQSGLQPNTLVPNDPITLPPIGAGAISTGIMRDYGSSDREQDYWSPRNADYAEGGVFTMRRGLENSINVVTAHLLAGGIDGDPVRSLDEVCATAKAAKLYTDCVRYYPFVLGAQPVRMIDLAAFYAAVANEGARPQPHAIDSIETRDGRIVYAYPKVPLFSPISAADGVSFYQLKTMLQGVVARGTARAIAGLSPYVAGKTGTTEDAVDGWFVGFTNDVTIAVWVGYDNGDGKRRSLGSNQTGARVALPIFKPILDAIWSEHIAPKAPLVGPSREVQRLMVDMPIDYATGTPANAPRNNDFGIFSFGGNTAAASNGGFVEHFRRGADGQPTDTQYQIVSRDDAYNAQTNAYYYGGQQGDDSRWTAGRAYYPNQGWSPALPRPAPPQPVARGLFQPWPNSFGAQQQAPRQDYFWGGRYN
ncbi:MAG TPA: transglycosylase domain-containing protein [Xanthobacteraceae bacterium]|nr:transglycosylase domain-containing protein [Xanthobacteraceae bacterium]